MKMAMESTWFGGEERLTKNYVKQS